MFKKFFITTAISGISVYLIFIIYSTIIITEDTMITEINIHPTTLAQLILSLAMLAVFVFFYWTALKFLMDKDEGLGLFEGKNRKVEKWFKIIAFAVVPALAISMSFSFSEFETISSFVSLFGIGGWGLTGLQMITSTKNDSD